MSNVEFINKSSTKSVKEVLSCRFDQKLTTKEIEEMEAGLLKMLELLMNQELKNIGEIVNESYYIGPCFHGHSRRWFFSGCPA